MMLLPDDRDSIRRLYNERYAGHGADHRTVGWGSAADQNLRFAVLCRQLSLQKKAILDVGCGLGDLVPFIKASAGDDFTYHGIDISESLLAHAQQLHGSERIRFSTLEPLQLPDEPYDIAVVSGALSFRIQDNIGYARQVIARLFSVTREAVAVNFLSTYVDYQAEKNFHYSPEDMLRYCKSLTRYVNLYHDYPLWEFTVQLFHKPAGQ